MQCCVKCGVVRDVVVRGINDAVQCCVKCGVVRDVVVRGINDAADIWRDLKCGVEYMECGVTGYVNSV